MAAKFEQHTDASTELIEGAGGIFDVKVDGKLVYSKHETGEFPNEDALVGEVAATT